MDEFTYQMANQFPTMAQDEASEEVLTHGSLTNTDLPQLMWHRLPSCGKHQPIYSQLVATPLAA